MSSKNPRGRKPVPKPAPVKPPEGRPVAPDYVAKDPIALAKFDELVEHLDALGILSRTDVDAIALFATTFSDYRDNLARIAAEGKVVKTKAGFLANSPYVNQRNQNLSHLEKLSRELGLTPAARAKVQVAPKTEGTDALTLFLRRGAG